MMSWKRVVAACKPPGSYLNPGDMEKLGVRNISRVAKAYNLLRDGSLSRYRKMVYREHYNALIAENGAPKTKPVVMEDGWAIDTSRTLPHLDAVLEDADQYIAEFGMQNKGASGREFIRDIMVQDRLARFPSFLNFITSSEVMSTVSNYLGFVPVLSTTAPPGVRFVESSANGQAMMGEYRTSQFHHLDLHDSPLVYVIVLLRDVTAQSGPFTFLAASTSAKAARALNYMKRGVRYHITDEQMYRVVDRSEEKVFAYPRGTVLFLDSSKCFHFGSRDAVVTRYQMMYAYVSPCRSDFTESFMPPRIFPVKDSDSRLRKLALQKKFVPQF